MADAGIEEFGRSTIDDVMERAPPLLPERLGDQPRPGGDHPGWRRIADRHTDRGQQPSGGGSSALELCSGIRIAVIRRERCRTCFRSASPPQWRRCGVEHGRAPDDMTATWVAEQHPVTDLERQRRFEDESHD
jgi:hypothetical protein